MCVGGDPGSHQGPLSTQAESQRKTKRSFRELQLNSTPLNLPRDNMQDGEGGEQGGEQGGEPEGGEQEGEAEAQSNKLLQAHMEMDGKA